MERKGHLPHQSPKEVVHPSEVSLAGLAMFAESGDKEEDCPVTQSIEDDLYPGNQMNTAPVDLQVIAPDLTPEQHHKLQELIDDVASVAT